MDPVHSLSLSLFSLALALSCLSGVNLYLTMLLGGLAARSGWLGGEVAGALEFLGHPVLLAVAGGMFLVELITDKVPWVDTGWDAPHTVIRPAGAVLLALQIAGPVSPGTQVALGALAGAAALTTHLTKSALRLIVNASPEPFSNIIVSVVEDVMVAGLLLLSMAWPLAGLLANVAILAALWVLLPRLFRLARALFALLWKKLPLPLPGVRPQPFGPGGAPPASLDARGRELLRTVFPGESAPRPVWSARALTGEADGVPGLHRNTFGRLVSVEGHPGVVVFIERRWFRRRPVRILLPGCDVYRDTTFLSENLVIDGKADGVRAVFRFARSERELADALARDLRGRLGLQAPAPVLEPFGATLRMDGAPRKAGAGA